MDYATKELTHSLQQIAACEAQQDEAVCDRVIMEKHVYSAGALTLPTGVDRFLATRRDFQERTRGISVGSY